MAERALSITGSVVGARKRSNNPVPVSLATGRSLGPYTIQAPLGAGGMGEVYRARDARLNRDVASLAQSTATIWLSKPAR